MFCSRSVGIHLLRGLGAVSLIALALYLITLGGLYPVLVAALSIGGAIFLLRGCPMCWLMGLMETIARQRGSKDPS